MIKSISYPIIFLLFVFSFISPAAFSLWKEFHQSAAAVCACLLLYVTTGKFHQAPNKTYSTPLALLVVLIIISFFIHQNFYKAPTIVGIIYISCAILISQAAARLGKNIALNFITAILFAVAVISIAIQTIQILGFTPDFYPWVYQMHPAPGMRPYANIGQPNILASIYLTLACLLLWMYAENKINNYWLAGFIPMLAYGIALTQSRTAYLATILLSLAFLLQRTEKPIVKCYFPALLITIIAIAKIVADSYGVAREITENLNNGRFDIWRMGIEAVKRSPIIGYGFHETARATIGVIEISNFKHSLTAQIHNLFLDIVIWFGLPAGTVLIGYILRALYITCKNALQIKYFYPAATLVPFFIHSLLEYPLYYANTLMVFGFLLGLNSLYLKNEKNNE